MVGSASYLGNAGKARDEGWLSLEFNNYSLRVEGESILTLGILYKISSCSVCKEGKTVYVP